MAKKSAVDGDGFTLNLGSQPREMRRKRVRVKLRELGDVPVEPEYHQPATAKPGWEADHSRWSFSADDDPCRRFDIMAYRII